MKSHSSPNVKLAAPLNVQSKKIAKDLLAEDAHLGTHFCLLYQTKQDLIEIVLPYIEMGLEANEYCMWIASDQLPKEEIEKALRTSIPNFEKYVQKGQIEILPYTEWYLIEKVFSPQATIDGWINKINYAKEKGFKGLRATGDSGWVTDKTQGDFIDYEATINRIIGNYPMTAICTYYLRQYEPYEFLQMTISHQFVLMKHLGVWKNFISSKQYSLEEKLKKSEENYRTLFESNIDGIASCDKQGNIVDVNPAFSNMTGYTKNELQNKNIQEITPSKWHKPESELLQKLILREEEKISFEKEYIHKDGTIFPVNLSAWTIKTENDQVQKIGGIIRDITEDKKSQAERVQMEAAKLESLGILAGGIAHDFNNILTGIMGNINLVKTQLNPESKIYQRLNSAEKASIRAKALTQQLLTFAQGGLPIKNIISIKRIIEDSTNFSLQRSNVTPDFLIADDLWSINADEGQLSQVISNLVLNAKEAMPMGGKLELKAHNAVLEQDNAQLLPLGNYVKTVIKDQGIGISEEHINHIFDPYFTTKQAGNGLGLSSSYYIIKNHNGYIKVDSIKDKGSTFSVYLPASKLAMPKQKAVSAQNTSYLKHEGKILVMDDQEIIRKLISDMLEDVGYKIELASDGNQAVEMYKKSKLSACPFDAVILDLTVPAGMGGKETIKKLLDFDPDVKALVSSGYATDPVMAQYKEYGFKEIVTKPFNS